MRHPWEGLCLMLMEHYGILSLLLIPSDSYVNPT